ncbi:NAD(P)/FAD-dependent oxidoreductase [Sphingomonas japonica]|nr:FAD-dependent oxidoreductase [Sphingomonas japonica]
MIRADIAIIGAGMAGASLAAEIAAGAQVVLVEAETAPGMHATGRSAAFWSETYGGPGIQPLTSASGPILASPPPELGEEGFLSPRGELLIGRAEDAGLLDAFVAEFAGSSVRLDRVAPADHVPGIHGEWQRGVLGPSCSDIDVARLHAAYLALARRRGAQVMSDATVTALDRRDGAWHLSTRAGMIVADTIVDAAGAWAGPVAAMAGAQPIAIAPLRRTMVQLRVSPPVPADLPLVIDARGGFYFKPDAGGRLWLSPHDETPVAPGDVAAEEIDVAIAIDRLERVVDWRIEAVERRWAGLRSFAPDRLPVYGFDRRAPGFFWCAGQGGFGIQTAPAAAKLAAALLLSRAPETPVAHIDPEPYAPGRFA